MTADYLLTAKDLPGWSGEYPPINYKNLIIKCFVELSSGFYSKDRIFRELHIVKKIAEKHDLMDYFNFLLKSSRRQKNRDHGFEGSGLSPSKFFFDSITFEINNIYDAAYATKLFYHLTSSISIRNFLFLLRKSIKHYFSKSRLGEKFPTLDDL